MYLLKSAPFRSPPTRGVVSAFRLQIIKLWDNLEAGVEDNHEDDWISNPYELLPAGPEYSHYIGSLTTPPCTEVRTSLSHFFGGDGAQRGVMVTSVAPPFYSPVLWETLHGGVFGVLRIIPICT